MTYRGPLVCIVGPTASGKSAVAEELALLVEGQIVSVDAMQVYCGMDIGTAKTPVSERRCALHMVDVCPIGENYSVERFQADARACIDNLIAQNIAPILCGGTGLYLNAVIDEMDFPAGHRDDGRRAEYEALAAAKGSSYLYDLLSERDPLSAQAVHPNNVRRVIRALEMCDEGKSYAASLNTLHKRRSHYPARIFGLAMNRETLYGRIDARVDKMFDDGLVEEVVRLKHEGLDRTSTAGQAIGYKEILDALAGSCTLEEARDKIKKASRRYAKRQISWFRHDERVSWIDMDAHTAQSAAHTIFAEVYDASL